MRTVHWTRQEVLGRVFSVQKINSKEIRIQRNTEKINNIGLVL